MFGKMDIMHSAAVLVESFLSQYLPTICTAANLPEELPDRDGVASSIAGGLHRDRH